MILDLAINFALVNEKIGNLFGKRKNCRKNIADEI